MSSVREADPVAVVCSDLHLSLKPPIARAREEDWLEAQKRVLEEIRRLTSSFYTRVPLLCAGDIFDRWNSPPELINWAIRHLGRFSKIYAVPGQHDLPLHNLENVHKSAYQTLIEAEVITSLGPEYHARFEKTNWTMDVHGFPWGVPLHPTERSPEITKVALIHQYVWKEGCSYPKAPKTNYWSRVIKGSQGWDTIVSGDNHQGFMAVRKGTVLFNCGTLMRRKSDEIEYEPQIGILYSDGTIEPHYLNTKDDIIVATEKTRTPEEDMELKEFLEELTKLGDTTLDFKDAMKEVLEDRKPSQAVRELILEAMEI